MDINYTRIPGHMRDTARLYIERGIGGGGFFTALVSNDLMNAFRKADDENTAAMRNWVGFLYNEAPAACYGSPERVRDWIEAGGLEGLKAKREGEAA